MVTNKNLKLIFVGVAYWREYFLRSKEIFEIMDSNVQLSDDLDHIIIIKKDEAPRPMITIVALSKVKVSYSFLQYFINTYKNFSMDPVPKFYSMPCGNW